MFNNLVSLKFQNKNNLTLYDLGELISSVEISFKK